MRKPTVMCSNTRWKSSTEVKALSSALECASAFERNVRTLHLTLHMTRVSNTQRGLYGDVSKVLEMLPYVLKGHYGDNELLPKRKKPDH